MPKAPGRHWDAYLAPAKSRVAPFSWEKSRVMWIVLVGMIGRVYSKEQDWGLDFHWDDAMEFERQTVTARVDHPRD